MIFENDIRDSKDGNTTTCMRPFNGATVWRITRSGFLPPREELYAESKTRALIDREKLLRFSYHRGCAKVLGVNLNSKDLQTFVEHLEGDELDVRVVGDLRGLAVGQGETGLALIGGVEFVQPEVAETFSMAYGEADILPEMYDKKRLEKASNLAEFASWVESVANGPAKIPHTLDFENVDGILSFNPKFGPPTPVLWFDEDGNGPAVFEVMIDGWDSVGTDGTRTINRRVGILMPGTVLKGGGSFNLQTLTAHIEACEIAKAWVLAGMAVPGCTCGECETWSDERCESAKAMATSREPQAVDCQPLIDSVRNVLANPSSNE